jgi:hypothetical protein
MATEIDMIALSLLAIYGLAFALKQTDGPFGLVSKWRNWMMRLPIIGVQFYHLLDCYFCLGCWCGVIVYGLSTSTFMISQLVIWGLAGGVICLLMDAILVRLSRE